MAGTWLAASWLVLPSDVTASGGAGYYLHNFIGNPPGTGIAIGSLLFGRVLDRFPGLKLVFAHGGGTAPCLVGRWSHGATTRPEPRVTFTGSVDEALHRLYLDTVVYDSQVLCFLVGFAGADHVLLGTDYSGDMADWRDQVSCIRAVHDLSEREKDLILGGNAARLLGLEGVG